MKMRKSFRSRLVKRLYGNTHKRKRLLLLATYISTTSFTVLIGGLIAIFVLFAVLSPFLPDPNKLAQRNTELSTKILDRNGKVLFELYGDENRTLVKYDEVSHHLVNATLATEDRTFFEHSGFAFFGIVRAVFNRLRGQGLQGGSTITQQVVKNTLLSSERTLPRKIKEFILSLEIENKYTKEEILH